MLAVSRSDIFITITYTDTNNMNKETIREQLDIHVHCNKHIFRNLAFHNCTSSMHNLKLLLH